MFRLRRMKIRLALAEASFAEAETMATEMLAGSAVPYQQALSNALLGEAIAGNLDDPTKLLAAANAIDLAALQIDCVDGDAFAESEYSECVALEMRFF